MAIFPRFTSFCVIAGTKLVIPPTDSSARCAGSPTREAYAPPETTPALTPRRTLLGQAIFRLDEEVKRREHSSSRQPMIDSAKRALEMRSANEDKTANLQPVSVPQSTKTRPKKAQIPTRALKNPAMIGAVSQRTKNMQAKRDGK